MGKFPLDTMSALKVDFAFVLKVFWLQNLGNKDPSKLTTDNTQESKFSNFYHR